MTRPLVLSSVGVILEGSAVGGLYVLDAVYPPFPAAGVAVFVAFAASPFFGLAGFVGGLREVRETRRTRGRAGPGLAAMAIGATTLPLPTLGCLLAVFPAVFVWQFLQTGLVLQK